MGVQKLTGGGGRVGSLILSNGIRLFTGSGAPTDGTSGTGVGKAAPGSQYYDYTNAKSWINIGTKASPVWVSNGVHSVEVAITNAQIKALRATPKTLVAAPGASRVNEYVGMMLIHDYGTNALTESADNLAVRYTNGSGAQVSTDIEATGFVDATADKVINSIPQKDVICVPNAALVLHNTGDGEYGGNAAADTVWRAKVSYRVWPTGL